MGVTRAPGQEVRTLEHDIRLDHARYLVEHRDNPIVAKRIAEILARPIGKTG